MEVGMKMKIVAILAVDLTITLVIGFIASIVGWTLH
jgi:hypothetical protein